ncbi:MAG: hypothetical protein LC640_01945 [Frankia sp.]|nr:hypothetical protein [Frankia sp.]
MVGDSAVDALYAAPAEEFVARRDALANELRRSGDGERATAVRALRRPTVAAWAVNQLARSHGDEVGALLAAGDELRAVQRRALSGLGGSELRAAAAARHEVVDALTALAQRELRVSGKPLSPTVLDAVRATLYAASADAALGEQLQAGRLERELQSSGFGGLEGLSLVATTTPARGRPAANASTTHEKPTPAANATKTESKKLQRARERRDAAAARASELNAEADAIATEVETLERRVTESAAEARQAQELADAAQEVADAAAAALARATKRRARAEHDAARAAEALAQLDAELDGVSD